MKLSILETVFFYSSPTCEYMLAYDMELSEIKWSCWLPSEALLDAVDWLHLISV